MDISGNMMKVRIKELVRKIKSMSEEFKREIYECIYENDIRSSCYDAFVDHLNYFATVAPVVLRSENKKLWVGKLIKQTYISVLSTMEYAMRKILEKYPESLLYRKVIEYSTNNGGFEKISLTKIVKFSADVGIFNKNMKNTFENIIEMRHLIIHNNAVSNSDDIKKIGEVEIKLKKGETLPIKITDLLEIITIAIKLFHRWNLELAKNNGFTRRGWW